MDVLITCGVLLLAAVAQCFPQAATLSEECTVILQHYPDQYASSNCPPSAAPSSTTTPATITTTTPAPTTTNAASVAVPTTHAGCECTLVFFCPNYQKQSLPTVRADEKHCESSFDVCCPVADSDKTTEKPPTPVQDNRKCGVSHLVGENRITIKDAAQYGEFPWMIAVFQTFRENRTVLYHCGGSLIHPRVVLTAAHKVLGKDNLLIRAGEWDTRNRDEQFPHQDRVVEEVITHDQFDKWKYTNNPALLILKSPVNMSYPSVGLVCLPSPGDTMDGRTCFASGWGKDQEGPDGIYQQVMKKVELPVVGRDECEARLRQTPQLKSRYKLHPSHLCAGGVRGQDTCKGDGGGPLVCPRTGAGGVLEQAGIVTYGVGACGSDVPAVYVNVAGFVDWIHDQLQQRGISLS